MDQALAVFFYFLLFVCYGAEPVVVDAAAGHLRKVATEGSTVSLTCRLPNNRRLNMMDEDEEDRPEPSVIWLRFDMKDPTSQEVISHGDTLLTDTNPRMRVSFEEETATSVLMIEGAQVQDGGIFQCQVWAEDKVLPSSPIQVIIEALQATSDAGSSIIVPVGLLLPSLIAIIAHLSS